MVYAAALSCGQFFGGLALPIVLGDSIGMEMCGIDTITGLSPNQKKDLYCLGTALTISVALRVFAHEYLSTPVKLGLNLTALFLSATLAQMNKPPRKAAFIAILVGVGLGAVSTAIAAIIDAGTNTWGAAIINSGLGGRSVTMINAGLGAGRTVMTDPAINSAIGFLSGLFISALSSYATIGIIEKQDEKVVHIKKTIK